MVFCLTVLNQQAQIREFMLMSAQIEIGLDFVNSLVAKGEIIVKVLVDDGNKQTELPLHIFDGKPFVISMHELEQEWQAFLNQPVRPISKVDQELIDLTRKRLHLCENSLANQQLMIDRFEALLQRADAKSSFNSIRSTLGYHYEHQISVYTQLATQSLLRLEWINQRLKALR